MRDLSPTLGAFCLSCTLKKPVIELGISVGQSGEDRSVGSECADQRGGVDFSQGLIL